MDKSQYRLLAERIGQRNLRRIDDNSEPHRVIRAAYKEIAIPEEEADRKISQINIHGRIGSLGPSTAITYLLSVFTTGITQFFIDKFTKNELNSKYEIIHSLITGGIATAGIYLISKLKLRKLNRETKTILDRAYSQAHLRETDELPEDSKGSRLEEAIEVA